MNNLAKESVFLADFLQKTEILFLKAGMEMPKSEAWWLFREVLPDWNGIVRQEDRLSPEAEKSLSSAIARRLKHEPLAYISGVKGFWNDDFKVNNSTLIPRADSEALIELFLRLVPDKQLSAHLLDLGTGTGCLLLTILREYPHFLGKGTDIIPEAVSLAKENAHFLGLTGRSEFFISDWAGEVTEKFDFIISNPPYIKTEEIAGLMPEVSLFEPHSALDGGKDGLECYRIIFDRAEKILSQKGKIFLEIGEGQDPEICQIAKTRHFSFLGEQCDLAGKIRALAFIK